MSDVRELVSMVNQIATFFSAYPEDEAVNGIATHVRDFWDKRMRDALIQYVANGAEDLNPLAQRAALMLAAAERARG